MQPIYHFDSLIAFDPSSAKAQGSNISMRQSGPSRRPCRGVTNRDVQGVRIRPIRINPATFACGSVTAISDSRISFSRTMAGFLPVIIRPIICPSCLSVSNRRKFRLMTVYVNVLAGPSASNAPLWLAQHRPVQMVRCAQSDMACRAPEFSPVNDRRPRQYRLRSMRPAASTLNASRGGTTERQPSSTPSPVRRGSTRSNATRSLPPYSTAVPRRRLRVRCRCPSHHRMVSPHSRRRGD
jgi:hypothetical protein